MTTTPTDNGPTVNGPTVNGPTVNGQVIGQAHLATRALLDPVLDRAAITFPQSVVLNAIADSGEGGDSGEGLDREQLIGRMTGALKVTTSDAADTIAGLAASGLLESLPRDDSRLRLTEAGQARNREIRTAIAALTERLYGGIPAEDLATAGRVLTLITSRANDELAALR